MKPQCALVLFAASALCHAAEVSICYNWDCGAHATVTLNKTQMGQLQSLLVGAPGPGEERGAIAEAIGLIQRFAGAQTPTWRDKGGNRADEGVDGRMDCIDHSTNTTAYLLLFERQGWLKFHRAAEIASRSLLVFFHVHRSAVIEEIGSRRRYAVDTWFFDNGHPAVISSLDDWLHGDRPDD
ncbi:MAG: hypothetical protein ACREUA_03560 [Burkholderiales bacterium]